MAGIQPPLYIKNLNEYKLIQQNLLLARQKHQGKFSGRKNQTNNWLVWLNQHKYLLSFEGESLEERRMISGVYNCLNNKIDGIRFDKEKKTYVVRFISGYTCQKYKLCANCARLKANQNIGKFKDFLDKHPPLIAKNRYLLVLGVKHSKEDSFDDVYKKLDTSLQKIRQSIKDASRGRTVNSIFRFFEGALLSIEFTHNDNGWNPHVNILFCTDHNFELKEVWNKITKKFGTMSQEISDAWLQKTGDSYTNSMEKVFAKERLGEIMKYITKFSELPHDKRLELFTKSHNFRFLRKWGVFRGAKIDEDSLDDVKRKSHEILIPTNFDRERKAYVIDLDTFRTNFNTINSQAIQDDDMSVVMESFFNGAWNKEEGFL